MDIQKIKELALANGFKLKEQASGNMDLNAYVYDFANAIEQAAKAKAVPECKWIKNEDGFYDTSCTNAFVFPEPEDTPKYHDFTHCSFCGGELIEAQEQTNE